MPFANLVFSVTGALPFEITSLLEGVGSNEETIPVKFSVMDTLPTEIQNYILERI